MKKPFFRRHGQPRVAGVAILLATAVAVGSCAPSNPKFTFTYAEKRGVLESNGLRFVIIPDKTTELVEVDVRYDVGSRNDPKGMAGLAHLVEHMMFQTRPDGPDSPPLFQSIATLSSRCPGSRAVAASAMVGGDGTWGDVSKDTPRFLVVSRGLAEARL